MLSAKLTAHPSVRCGLCETLRQRTEHCPAPSLRWLSRKEHREPRIARGFITLLHSWDKDTCHWHDVFPIPSFVPCVCMCAACIPTQDETSAKLFGLVGNAQSTLADDTSLSPPTSCSRVAPSHSSSRRSDSLLRSPSGRGRSFSGVKTSRVLLSSVYEKCGASSADCRQQNQLQLLSAVRLVSSAPRPLRLFKRSDHYFGSKGNVLHLQDTSSRCITHSPHLRQNARTCLSFFDERPSSGVTHSPG